MAWPKLRFSPRTWAFTFSYAAAGTDALLWIHAIRPPAAAGYGVMVIALITALIAGIAVRTVVAAARGQLPPPPPPPELGGCRS